MQVSVCVCVYYCIYIQWHIQQKRQGMLMSSLVCKSVGKRQLGGSGGIIPRKLWSFRSSEIISDAYVGF